MKKIFITEYRRLLNSAMPNRDKLKKITQLMEQYLGDFGKVEFYIGTKEKQIDFIESIVTEADKKRYHEVQQKL